MHEIGRRLVSAAALASTALACGRPRSEPVPSANARCPGPATLYVTNDSPGPIEIYAFRLGVEDGVIARLPIGVDSVHLRQLPQGGVAARPIDYAGPYPPIYTLSNRPGNPVRMTVECR